MQGIIGGQIPAIPALELDEVPIKELPDDSGGEPQPDKQFK
jgi:hypothetical protein